MQSIALKALGVMLGAFFIFTAQTAGQSESCFAHKELYTTVPVEIRSGPGYLFVSVVGKTQPRKTYQVYESEKAAIFGSCWIRIYEGWLLRKASGSAIRPKIAATSTPEITPQSNTVSSTPTPKGKRCFQNNRAYVTGSMNIRKSPNASSGKVGTAQAGQSFTVTGTRQGDTYCWLKISKGWMAKTGRVSSSKPAVTSKPAVRTTSSGHVFANLTVQGPASFKSAVNKALTLLRNRAPSWYNYVIAKRTVIAPNSRRFPFTVSYTELGGSHTHHLWIGSTHDKDTGILAGVLVHESCHVHQWDDGRHRALGRIGREVECMEFQVEAMQQATPGHWFIRKIKELLRDPSRLYG